MLSPQSDIFGTSDPLHLGLKPKILTIILSFNSGYDFVPIQWPSLYNHFTSFLQQKESEGPEAPSAYPWGIPDSYPGNPVNQVAHTRAIWHIWPPVLQFHSQVLSKLWMDGAHFDDLFKQFVRSTTSCMHMIQNINVCCSCNFSRQLMHQQKMTFIPERCNFFTNSDS